MREITHVGATPNRLSVLFRHLAGEDEKALERSRLAALIGPKSLAMSADAGEDNAFSDCLTVGKDLGFFLEEGEIVRLSNPSSADKIAESFEDELAVRLIDNVETASSSEGAVAGAIAWMLWQDPRKPLKWTGSSSVILLRNQFRENVQLDFGITNDSRFQQAVYWARALGFVTRTNLKEEVVIPDPTRAIKHRLDKILPSGNERLLSTFLSDLADCCPVFEGGSIRIEVEGLMRPEFQRDVGTVSPSTALALQRLKMQGLIDLKRLDDGQVLFIEGALDDGRVSHISRN